MQSDNAIRGFKNEYRWLSNFYPVRIEFGGIKYPSVEHAYVAAKIEDKKKRPLIAMAASAAEAKRLGKVMKSRDDWEEVKDEIMFEFLTQKFTTPKLMKLLLETGNSYLEETNWWNDTYWGVCNSIGQNRLGKMIMTIRGDLGELNANETEMLVNFKNDI